MRTIQFIIAVSVLLYTAQSQAAVIQLPGRIEVDGVLDGGIIAPGVTGDTMDYLTFEVTTEGPVTLATGATSALRLQLAQFIGIEEDGEVPFGFLGNPYRLEGPSMFTRTLAPGIYVAAMGVRENTSYDVFDGYQPVNEEGGGFTFGPYAYFIEGPVRALNFREGNLNGTFTFTQIPEPQIPLLLITSLAFLAQRCRGSRNSTPNNCPRSHPAASAVTRQSKEAPTRWTCRPIPSRPGVFLRENVQIHCYPPTAPPSGTLRQRLRTRVQPRRSPHPLKQLLLLPRP